MPAGIKYDFNPLGVERELWNQKTSYRLSGGFNLVADNLVAGSFIPPLCPLAIDFKTRRATPVRNVLVVEDIAGTSLKIAKASLAYTGMHLGKGNAGATVQAIDTTNAEYDTLTLSATIAGVKKGDVLFESSAVGGTTVKNVANALNFARVKVEEGATLTALGQAYEIKETRLYLPISEKDKATLGDRFMFV